jgi:hypothetical protein
MWFYYLFWAFRLLKKEALFLYGVLPLSFFLGLLFFGVFLWASISFSDDEHECAKPQWIIFSTSQLFIVQLFLITVIYICWKLNQVRTVRINRWSQKAQLIFIVISYEIFSLLLFTYDVFFLAAGNDNNCQTVITFNEGLLIFIDIVIQSLRFLCPQIAIVIVYAPLKQRSSDDHDTVVAINGRNVPHRFYDSTNPRPDVVSFPSDKDPLVSYPINHSMKPSSPEDHFPSLPRSTPYTPTSGFNFYNIRSSSSATNNGGAAPVVN